MKRAIAAMATGMILLAVLWLSRGSSIPAAATRAGTPEECINAMFESAARGDVDGYVECFTGPERERLERARKGQSQAQFAQSLVDGVQRLKGRAVYASPPYSSGDRVAAYTIERIYESRTDRQEVEMVLLRGSWKIAQVRAVQPIQPTVPYGTPVFETPEPSDVGG